MAAYALGALDATEAEAFRRHLETCTVCQEELTSFQKVVEELPLTAPQHKAPAAIRRHVMREVNADVRTARRGAGAQPRARRTGLAWLVPRSALAQAVAVLVAVGVVAAVIASRSSGPATQVFTGQVVGTGRAHMRVSPGRASLVVHNFAQPPAGKIYEIWLVRGKHAPVPTSPLFSVPMSGNAVVDVAGNMKGVTAVLVTPEPMGGSPHPTHTPVISVSLD